MSLEYTVKVGKEAEIMPIFRVLAQNEAGTSLPSNTVGPVQCKDDIGEYYQILLGLFQVRLLRQTYGT